MGAETMTNIICMKTWKLERQSKTVTLPRVPRPYVYKKPDRLDKERWQEYMNQILRPAMLEFKKKEEKK
jgi:hypothetical protein